MIGIVDLHNFSYMLVVGLPITIVMFYLCYYIYNHFLETHFFLSAFAIVMVFLMGITAMIFLHQFWVYMNWWTYSGDTNSSVTTLLNGV